MIQIKIKIKGKEKKQETYKGSELWIARVKYFDGTTEPQEKITRRHIFRGPYNVNGEKYYLQLPNGLPFKIFENEGSLITLTELTPFKMVFPFFKSPTADDLKHLIDYMYVVDLRAGKDIEEPKQVLTLNRRH